MLKLYSNNFIGGIKLALKNALHFSLEIWGAIFCVISAVCAYISRNINTKINKTLFSLLITDALLLLFDSLAWFFRGKEGTFSYYILFISNFMVFILGYVLLFTFTLYLKNTIEKNTEVKTILIPIVYGICIVASLLVIISQFTDFYYYFDAHNFYHRNKWFPLSQIWGIIGIIINIIMVARYKKYLSKRDSILFIIYLLMPFIALCIQVYFYGISLLNIANTTLILIIFILSQIEQATTIVEQEKMINEANINIAISQIQPHFLYNCLNTIRYLCKHDTVEAVDAINEFSDYLRGNMESISTKKCIPLTRELKHIQNYVALEKKRFAEKLTVEYDLKETDFIIPALSLQPIVENSIKYGLMQNMDGIKVKISSESDENNYILRVEDNGLGFDYEKAIKDGKTHIGIKNVRNKLKLMNDGKLVIDSTIGKGTIATIIIPKDKRL